MADAVAPVAFGPKRRARAPANPATGALSPARRGAFLPALPWRQRLGADPGRVALPLLRRRSGGAPVPPGGGLRAASAWAAEAARGGGPPSRRRRRIGTPAGPRRGGPTRQPAPAPGRVRAGAFLASHGYSERGAGDSAARSEGSGSAAGSRAAPTPPASPMPGARGQPAAAGRGPGAPSGRRGRIGTPPWRRARGRFGQRPKRREGADRRRAGDGALVPPLRRGGEGLPTSPRPHPAACAEALSSPAAATRSGEPEAPPLAGRGQW